VYKLAGAMSGKVPSNYIPHEVSLYVISWLKYMSQRLEKV
jgi:hypothetical protein